MTAFSSKLSLWAQSLREGAGNLRIPAWAKWAVQAGCFALAVVYLVGAFRGNTVGLAERLRTLRWEWAAGALALLFMNQLLAAFILRVALDGRGTPLPFGRTFWISAVSDFHSLILPFQAGLGTRALALKQWAGLRYSDYARMSLGLWAMLLVACCWLGGLALVPPTPSGAALGLAASAAVLLGIRRAGLPNGPALAALYAATQALSGLRFFCLFAAFGNPPGLRDCFIMACLSVVAPLVAPVPGGLGVLESAIVLGGRMAQVPDEASLTAALANRFLYSALLCALGAAGSILIYRPRRG